MNRTLALGIDIGGSGIKAAMVNVATGQVVGAREVIPTPSAASPQALRQAVGGLAQRILAPVDEPQHCPWGVAFPGVIRHNTVKTAANLDPRLIDTCADELFVDVAAPTSPAPPKWLKLINDADAAGIAEARFGVAADVSGLVMMVTLGTGIGTALLHDGSLSPNTELGHLGIDGIEAEALAAGRVRKAEGLDWHQWGERLNTVLAEYERLLQPELFVLGGAVSRHLGLFGESLTVATDVLGAAMGNNAGIVGAALAAATGDSGRSDVADPTSA